MSWNESLYQYHKARGGQFLAGEADDGLLILTWKDRPLAVDLSMVTGGRSGAFSYVRARVPVTLARPYELTIGAEKALSGGVNTVLKSVSGIAGYSTDFGCPEVTKKRLIRTENIPFTKLVLGSLELRNALLACPEDKVEVRPGPGGGPHLITVTTAAAVNGFSGDGGAGIWAAGSISRVSPPRRSRPGRRGRWRRNFSPGWTAFWSWPGRLTTLLRSGRCEGLQHEAYPQAEALAVAVKALPVDSLPVQ